MRVNIDKNLNLNQSNALEFYTQYFMGMNCLLPMLPLHDSL